MELKYARDINSSKGRKAATMTWLRWCAWTRVYSTSPPCHVSPSSNILSSLLHRCAVLSETLERKSFLPIVIVQPYERFILIKKKALMLGSGRWVGMSVVEYTNIGRLRRRRKKKITEQAKPKQVLEWKEEIRNPEIWLWCFSVMSWV